MTMKSISGEYYTDPWPHLVIDDYYEADVFDTIKKHSKKFLSKNVDVKTRKQAFPFVNDPELEKAIESRPIDASYFDLFTNHREHEETLELYWEVNFLLGPYSYPIHDESRRKILSNVVYVDPEENEGTRLYDANKNLVKTVEWKPNRALIFAAIDGVTWHDYTCPIGKARITINQFLQNENQLRTQEK